MPPELLYILLEVECINVSSRSNTSVFCLSVLIKVDLGSPGVGVGVREEGDGYGEDKTSDEGEGVDSRTNDNSG